MSGITASWFGLLGVLLFVSAAIWGGLQFSDYSHLSQLISESYAMGTPYGFQLRYFGFLPSGVLMAAFAYSAARALPKSGLAKVGFAGLGVFYGMATVVVSVFPCDQGCGSELVEPSLSQVIHHLTGLLTYLVVPFCLLMLGMAALKWPNGKYVAYAGIACGLTAIVFVGMLSSHPHSNVAGLYQRIIEGAVLVWIVVCSWYLRTQARPRPDAPEVSGGPAKGGLTARV